MKNRKVKRIKNIKSENIIYKNKDNIIYIYIYMEKVDQKEFLCNLQRIAMAIFRF